MVVSVGPMGADRVPRAPPASRFQRQAPARLRSRPSPSPWGRVASRSRRTRRCHGHRPRGLRSPTAPASAEDRQAAPLRASRDLHGYLAVGVCRSMPPSAVKTRSVSSRRASRSKIRRTTSYRGRSSAPAKIASPVPRPPMRRFPVSRACPVRRSADHGRVVFERMLHLGGSRRR